MIPKPNHRIQKKKTLYWPSSSPLVSSNHHISYSIFNQTKQIHISISFLSQTKISDGPTSKPSIATSICDPYFFYPHSSSRGATTIKSSTSLATQNQCLLHHLLQRPMAANLHVSYSQPFILVTSGHREDLKKFLDYGKKTDIWHLVFLGEKVWFKESPPSIMITRNPDWSAEILWCWTSCG